jgi:hypothetical protein
MLGKLVILAKCVEKIRRGDRKTIMTDANCRMVHLGRKVGGGIGVGSYCCKVDSYDCPRQRKL